MEPTFLEKFNMPAKQLWANYKVFFIVFGILILIYKFREVIISLLVSSSRRAMDDARKQDANLKSEENALNNQANQLRDEANSLDNSKPKVDEDWNEK
jgi:cell division protein FtsB